MKILHLISQRPDSTGSGIYLQQIISRAARAGHENFLVCGLGPEDTVNLDGVETRNILPVRFETTENPGPIVGMSDVMPYPSRTFRSLDPASLARYRGNFQKALIAALERFTPDLIHSHHLWLLSALATELCTKTSPQIPIVTSCHGSDLRQFGQCPPLRDQVQSGCGRLDKICALSGRQKKQIEQTFRIDPQRISVTGAGFDKEIFYPPTSFHDPAGPPFTILYAGKLSRAKGVIWLLQALHRLQHFSFHLYLAGSGHGSEYEQCRHMAAPLEDRVTFLGSVSQQELAGLMRNSELFVLPSLFEGLPLVILEALACGCRVVATDLAGVKEIADHVDSTFLTMIPTPVLTDTDTTTLGNEERFVVDLQSSLLPFLSTPPSTARITAMHPGLDHFSWDSVFQRIQTLWQEIVTCSG